MWKRRESNSPINLAKVNRQPWNIRPQIKNRRGLYFTSRLEPRAGLEPTTFGLQNRCSTIKANKAYKEILLMVTDQICNNCLWLLTILYLLNYTAEVLNISLVVVFHQTSSCKIAIRRRDSHLFVASQPYNGVSFLFSFECSRRLRI